MLAALPAAAPDELICNWPDGRIKMFLTQRVLQFRREHADLFQRGGYSPLIASGTFAECSVSFARELAGKWIVVIAPRLSSRVGFPPIGERWKDTSIELPETVSLENAHDLFTCHAIRHEARKVSVADALGTLPFGVITNLR
jgi:(1->4)-alpha-D-glucan 1-alpha-D-glucosylmutase